ncbi:MAG: peptide deformylase [Patescibacteria group bacterium]
MPRSIVTYPNPILKSKAKDVQFPLDDYTKGVIEDMWRLVKDKGIGLASPQIGESLNICIINMSENEEESKRMKIPDFIMINPKITFYSEVKNRMVEGCLSFPDQWYWVVRPANIVVEFYDEEGKKQVLKAKNWLSRVIQHETDHLNGNVFIEHPSAKIIDPSEFE